MICYLQSYVFEPMNPNNQGDGDRNQSGRFSGHQFLSSHGDSQKDRGCSTSTRPRDDVDERVVENTIVRNVKRFMMKFGKDFAYVGNQYDLEVFGEEQRSDLLFFNRQLNCLVAIELKARKFKTAYLGQLYGYLQVLDDQVRKAHENPPLAARSSSTSTSEE